VLLGSWEYAGSDVVAVAFDPVANFTPALVRFSKVAVSPSGRILLTIAGADHYYSDPDQLPPDAMCIDIAGGQPAAVRVAAVDGGMLTAGEIALWGVPATVLAGISAASETDTALALTGINGFALSDSSTNGANVNYTGGFWEGFIVQAASSGTLNFLWIKGETVLDHTANYRLVIYQATDANDTAGPKLGETGVVSSLLHGENKKIPLLSPVSITSGNYYALGIHKDASMNGARRAASGGLRFADTFSDGALGTAPTGVNNGPSPTIWGTD